MPGYLRWSANVSAYVYLMRDEYPPFTLDAGKYPVTLEIEYPQELNRWLVLIKWLLAIPHFIVLFFLFIAWMVVTLIAFFAILFTKKYPTGHVQVQQRRAALDEPGVRVLLPDAGRVPAVQPGVGSRNAGRDGGSRRR